MNAERVRLAIAAGLALIVLSACSEKTAAIFLDGVGKPAPPRQKVRRDYQREVEQLKRELAESRRALEQARAPKKVEREAPAAEQAKTWAEAAELLPKDYSGQADWVQALVAGAIAPRPGFDPKTPEQAVFDFDVEFADAPGGFLHVTYPHAAHTRWLTCKNCHPAIFPLKRGRREARPKITMAAIKAGKYCGTCHGKVAFAPDQACARCHKGLPEQRDWQPSEPPRTAIERVKTWKEAERLLPATAAGPDWVKALADGVIAPRAGIDPKAPEQMIFPLNVELVPAGNPVFKVIFPHAVHTAVLSCASCHPALFQMKAGADPITMAKIMAGEYCGACHGKVAFAVPTGCPRCHAALATQ